MKKILFTTLSFLTMNFAIYAQQQTLNEMPNLTRYAHANEQLGELKQGEERVVFLGNSITDGWPGMSPAFFAENNYIGRGIGGQTSPQLLMRFQQDVISLRPVVVVINIGTNDIAMNTGDYNAQFTFDNIKSMAEIAKAHGIKVILTSVLPVGEYSWRPEVKNIPQVIDDLNAKIKMYATLSGLYYVDYNSPMRDAKGAMIAGYANDGVHPTAEGYKVMESLIKPAIDNAKRASF